MNKRIYYKLSIILFDFIALYIIYLLSQLITSNISLDGYTVNFMLFCVGFSLLKVISHLVFGNYSLLWMYRTKHNYIQMVVVTTISNLLIFLIIAILNNFGIHTMLYSTFFTSLFIEFFYIFASRFTINLYLENIYHQAKAPENKKRTMIVGAGQAGSMILTEFGLNKESKYNVVAFLDDSDDKINNKVNNVKVYGPISKINEYIDKLSIEEVIIAVPSAGKQKVQEIVNMIDYKNINVHIVPDRSKLLEGDLSSSLRKVSIDDLLGRDPIQLDTSGLNDFIGGKTILVTGGGGSIGSEICRQVLNYNPECLVIFDIYENTTYELVTELNMHYKKLNKAMPKVIALIGSVRDEARLDEVFNEYRPNIVFHAAAHKHVPLMEDSPKEAIKNNDYGTYKVCKYCDKYNVEKMVLISTDKAVNPTNVMGASKRFAEMIVEAWQKKSTQTNYSMVRFGNVLGSHGSVIPLFERQIQEGGPVTVTHQDINRFFMTIPEACGLVIQSGAYAKGGEKFILDMGKPVKIMDLAKKMIQLSGLVLGSDINIEVTGLRPGEKLYEELLLDYSKASKTENDKIFVEKSIHPFEVEKIDGILEHLLSISDNNKAVLAYLKEIENLKKEIRLERDL